MNAACVSQGRRSSRPRQNMSRRAGEAVRGVRACERAAFGGVCDGGACSRACAADGRGQLVLARGGGCVRACEAGR